MFLSDMPSSPQSIRSTHSGEFLGVGSKGAICGAIFNRRNCLMHILLGRRDNCLRGGGHFPREQLSFCRVIYRI